MESYQIHKQEVVLDIGDSLIRSSMTRNDVLEFLKGHPEIKAVKPRKTRNGFSTINLSTRDGHMQERLSLGFQEETIISMDRNTYEFHTFVVRN